MILFSKVEDGQYIAQGLSGIGVYIIKNRNHFLVEF
jgi:hypothetical protein